MNVKEILVRWLKSHGYDGLYNEECASEGCSTDNLVPCLDCFLDCVPAVKCYPGFMKPREEPDPVAICKKLECTGGLPDCPGNKECPAVEHMMKYPKESEHVTDYILRQIDLSRRCSFCHGENSRECDHCGGSGIEPGKES